MRILMILTGEPHERPDPSLSLDQIVEAYYLLEDSGAEVVIATSQGEHAPFHDGRHRSMEDASPLLRFQSDRRARDALSDPLKVEQIFPEDFDGAICVGAVELAARGDDAVPVHSLLKALLENDKPVAAVPGKVAVARDTPLDGMLIAGRKLRAPALAAKAILAALAQAVR